MPLTSGSASGQTARRQKAVRASHLSVLQEQARTGVQHSSLAAGELESRGIKGLCAFQKAGKSRRNGARPAQCVVQTLGVPALQRRVCLHVSASKYTRGKSSPAWRPVRPGYQVSMTYNYLCSLGL